MSNPINYKVGNEKLVKVSDPASRRSKKKRHGNSRRRSTAHS